MKRTLAVLTLGVTQLCLSSCTPPARAPSVDTKSSESVASTPSYAVVRSEIEVRKASKWQCHRSRQRISTSNGTSPKIARRVLGGSLRLKHALG
jgi:hypothetical protein